MVMSLLSSLAWVVLLYAKIFLGLALFSTQTVVSLAQMPLSLALSAAISPSRSSEAFQPWGRLRPG